ncbi:MAG: Spy/CpxP family protein refolding chaperone [Proteobacteria bacterium]|nr:Spy/CpxP family protein refolding chaperone [Pseudomonadota bacterium]
MKKPLIAALLFSIAAGPALAQQPTHAPERHRGAPVDRMCEDADARIASRLAFIEAKLKPSVDQRSAWDAFARDSRAAGEPMKNLCANPPARAAGNDPAAGLAMRERFVGAMAASLAILRPAVERLQAVLDDGQKTVLARFLNPREHGRPGRH